MPFIQPLLHFLAHGREGIQRNADILFRVGRRRNQAQDNHAFRDHRVHHDRAEHAVVVAHIHHEGHGFFHFAVHVHRRHAGIGVADVETALFQAVLQHAHVVPEFFAELRLVFQQFETFDRAFHERHGQRFGENLRAHVVAQETNDVDWAGDECADERHTFSEGAEIQVYVVAHALFFGGAGAGSAEHPKAVCVVDKQSEAVGFFQGCDFTQFALVAAHTEYPFRDDEDAAAGFVGDPFGTLEVFGQAVDVVVCIGEAFAHVHAHGIHNAGVAFRVVHGHVMARQQRIDDRQNALVAVVEQITVFLADEFGQAGF